MAADQERLAGHLRAVREAGLRPAGIDLNPIALLRSLGPVAGFGEGAEALVDVGARITYDTRLQTASPPYVQDITETPYRTSQFAEIQNPSGPAGLAARFR